MQKKYFVTISDAERIFFVDHLRIMIHAGLSVKKSLQTLAQDTRNQRIACIVADIISNLDARMTLNSALARHPKLLSPLYIHMIKAGEVNNTLETSLEQVVHHMKHMSTLDTQIKHALLYPLLTCIAMVGIGIGLATSILPRLVYVIDSIDGPLPLLTRILVETTYMFNNPLALSIFLTSVILFFLVCVFLHYLHTRVRTALHAAILDLPFIGHTIEQIQLAKLSLTISSLLRSAVSLPNALHIAGNTCTNLSYQLSLKKSSQSIKTGTPLSDTLRIYPNLYPPHMTESLMIGERTNNLSDSFIDLAKSYNTAAIDRVQHLGHSLEVFLFILFGLSIGLMVLALIIPLYAFVNM